MSTRENAGGSSVKKSKVKRPNSYNVDATDLKENKTLQSSDNHKESP
ncbi:unnamed protein product, partial [Amoebophrya sp. A25]|eukprot:GSA25T00025783001.1